MGDGALPAPDGNVCDGGICVAGACAPAICGDGVVTTLLAETCDGTPGCRDDCTSCGDGVVDESEECDDGVENSDVIQNACRAACVVASCGDGVRDSAEGCDDGPARSDVVADACRSTCARASCGDGIVDIGEDCDAGVDNGDAPDACRAACVLPSCGDGVVDVGEDCDDGAFNSDVRRDACRTICGFPTCGDGVTDASEECDDGGDNSDEPGSACRPSCLRSECGDAILDAGEDCDDGNEDDADLCRNTCAPARCGDGVVQAVLDEQCDDGNDNPFDNCVPGCLASRCGDLFINSVRTPEPETCDDGNAASFDGCSASCTRVAWTRQVASSAEDVIARSAAIVSFTGQIAVGTTGGEVVGLAVADGTELWRFTPDAPALPGAGIVSIAVGRGALVYAATFDGDVLAIRIVATADGGPGTLAFRSDAVGAPAGGTRIAVGARSTGLSAAVADKIVVVSADGTLTPLTESGGAFGFLVNQPGFDPAVYSGSLAASGVCTTCAVTLVNGAYDNADGIASQSIRDPVAALVPLTGSLWLWNFRSGCGPVAFALNPGEDAVGRIAFFGAHTETSYAIGVTSQGAVIQLDNATEQSCAPTDGNLKRFPGSFVTEPLVYQTSSAAPPTIIAVASDKTIHQFSFSATGEVTENLCSVCDSGGLGGVGQWPVLVQNDVRVPPSLDAQLNIYIVDELGGVIRISQTGTQEAIGSVSAPPAGGPLVDGSGIFIATVDGRVTALEGGGAAPFFPLRKSVWWSREGGNTRASSTGSMCGSTGGPATLAWLGLLACCARWARGRRTGPSPR